MKNLRSIGIFDSGVGGLTVYKALRAALPHENFIYLGDTARLPYGTKSGATVAQYALQAARYLVEEKIKLLVVACNTASALALPELQNQLLYLPCLGVIDPGAQEAAAVSVSGRIAVLATESTVRSGAYPAAIRAYRPQAEIKMLACNLLVGLAEEGWCEGPEAETVLRRYLKNLGWDFDTLVLGCTHFPLLEEAIRANINLDVHIVNSAVATAGSVAHYLRKNGLLHPQKDPGESRFLVTDAPERFAALAGRFLGGSIDLPLAHIDLNVKTESDLPPTALAS